MTEFVSLIQNQKIKSNTYTKTQIIHQVSSVRSIEQSFSTLSYNEKIFQKTLPSYQKALQKASPINVLTKVPREIT